MPELSFDWNLGSLLSPLAVMVLAGLGHRAYKAIIEHIDGRADRQDDKLAKIEKDLGDVKADAKRDRSELHELKTRVEVLKEVQDVIVSMKAERTPPL